MLLPQQRKYFKRSRKLLLCHMNKLSDENKAAAFVDANLFPDLREAYLSKKKFYEFMAANNSIEAANRSRAFRLHAAVADIQEFAPCLTMLRNWEPYILTLSIAVIPMASPRGVNNSIKVLKRIAYGYRNFQNFRRNFLYYIN